jgi:predicted phosphodiesterase
MKLLLLADLHFHQAWYRWIAAQSADLTAIAGDLLDGFSPGGLLPQMVSIKKWVDEFRGPLALSSGNHDGNIAGGAIMGEDFPVTNREAAMALLLREYWMDALERADVVTDRRSQVLETAAGAIVVTTIPFDFTAVTRTDDLWKQGAVLRRQHRARWLVLHHEPPADTLVGGLMGSTSLFYKIQQYQPDFVLSGHIHYQPYRETFADRIGRTWCFNPGMPAPSSAVNAKIPNHILLDVHRGTATWNATPNKGRTCSSQNLKLV